MCDHLHMDFEICCPSSTHQVLTQARPRSYQPPSFRAFMIRNTFLYSWYCPVGMSQKWEGEWMGICKMFEMLFFWLQYICGAAWLQIGRLFLRTRVSFEDVESLARTNVCTHVRFLWRVRKVSGALLWYSTGLHLILLRLFWCLLELLLWHRCDRNSFQCRVLFLAMCTVGMQ